MRRSPFIHPRPWLLAALLIVLVLGVPTAQRARAVDGVDTPPGGDTPGAGASQTPTKTIFLTFDDGPYEPGTRLILAALAEFNAHATFFIIGRQVPGLEDLVQQAYDAGNGIANHSYNHANLTGVSQWFFDAEVGDTHDLIKDVDSMCLRPPYGAIDYNVMEYADKLGYTVVKWNLDPEDWRNPGANVIAQNVINSARDGSIVVMHDGGGDRTQTAEAVRIILKTLGAQGYQFKALCRDVPMADDSLTEAMLGTPTPDPNAPATDTPTITPWPTATPTATPTAMPTATGPAPAAAHDTGLEGETPFAPRQAPTRTPTAAPSSTSSPTPTATATATPTAKATATPEATATAAATPTKPPTHTPAAPATPTATLAAALIAAPTTAAPVYGAITFPGSGAIVAGAVLVQGFADHPAFEKWQLDLLVNGSEEVFLALGDTPLPKVGRMAVWVTNPFPNGARMLRLRVVYGGGNYAEYFAHVTIRN